MGLSHNGDWKMFSKRGGNWMYLGDFVYSPTTPTIHCYQISFFSRLNPPLLSQQVIAKIDHFSNQDLSNTSWEGASKFLDIHFLKAT